jgi:hypothetical protein
MRALHGVILNRLLDIVELILTKISGFLFIGQLITIAINKKQKIKTSRKKTYIAPILNTA